MASASDMSWEQAVKWLKAQPDRQRLVRDCYYDDPLIEAAQRFHRSAEWRAVQRLLDPRSGKALEIGAGRGIASFALARDGWAVSALEPCESGEVGADAIVRLGQESGLPIVVSRDWGETLPYQNGAFDLVYCRAVLHHAADLRRLCAEAARVLRQGGVFLATREHVISSPSDKQVFLDSHPLHHLYGGENAYLLREYVDAIEAAGLQMIARLNPMESDINTSPDTVEDLKRRWSIRLRLPEIVRMPQLALTLAGALSRRPGRLYSFLASKR